METPPPHKVFHNLKEDIILNRTDILISSVKICCLKIMNCSHSLSFFTTVQTGPQRNAHARAHAYMFY